MCLTCLIGECDARRLVPPGADIIRLGRAERSKSRFLDQGNSTSDPWKIISFDSQCLNVSFDELSSAKDTIRACPSYRQAFLSSAEYGLSCARRLNDDCKDAAHSRWSPKWVTHAECFGKSTSRLASDGCDNSFLSTPFAPVRCNSHSIGDAQFCMHNFENPSKRIVDL